jgi:hypothetical protein
MRTKINITSEIISPLGNLELFKNKSNKEYLLLPKQNRMKMLSIMLRKEKKLSADEKN